MSEPTKDLNFLVGLLHAIAASHQGNVMLVGNVRAEQIVEICKHTVALRKRAEAAEEDRDGWKLRAMQSEQQRQSLRAERDALRKDAEQAVIEAAKVLADIIGLPLRADSMRSVTYPVVDSRATHRHTLADCAVTICFHNGVQEPNALTELLSAVATLREQEGA